MTIKFANRVKVSTSTTGTGTITLGSAVGGFQTFAQGGILNGNSVRYTIINGNNWEVGTGVYTHIGTTMSRSYEESSTGSLLNLAGESEVFITTSATDIENLGNRSIDYFYFTATSGQTAFTGNDDNSNQLAFFEDNVLVFLNGIVLEGGGTDYSVSGGNTITLSTGATVSDELNIVAFKSFTVADAVPKSTGGQFDANVDFAAGIDVTGNITVTGTVDGRDVATDGTKLDGIEASATADQTASEIRALVESATDSNVFTDADHSKLNAIEASATADQTGAEIKALYEAEANAYTDAKDTKLSGIETGATADQTAAEIRALVEAAIDSNVFTDADHSKLNAIEAGATGDQTNAEIRAAVEAAIDSNVFTDADHTKLNGIEANAKNDQTITAGGGLTGGGTGDVTISHSDTSSQASVNGSGRTYIQDITLDTYGHVTGLATATETVVDTNTIPNNATITLSAGNALTGGGNFTTDQSANETITFNHSDTSTQASVNNSMPNVIQDVTLDGYGHVTGLASANLDDRYFTESESDGRFVRKGVGYIWTATGGNALSFMSQNTIDTATGDQAALEIYQDNAGEDAFIQFHVAGDYGKYLGLHGAINDFVVGGWSHGASYQRLFHDGYHPNADKWTTARTLSLSGDASGSVSWDGSGNATLSVAVSNDSHTHDGRYYTESESDSRFAQKNTSTRQDFTGSIKVSTNNTTGGGIVLADDGDIVDLNDGYASMRFSLGVRIYSANGSGSVRHTLHSNGTFTSTGNINSQSDIRVKENIEPISDAMQKVQSINGVTFNRNDLDDTETRYVGVIAQDVEAVLPEAVSENDEGIKQVAYGNMVGLLIEAIKEQQTQIDDLKAEIQSMKS